MILAQPARNLYGDAEVSRVIGVHDGDTFTVDVNQWPAIIGSKIPVRVRGIDCAELKNWPKTAPKNPLEIRGIIEAKLRGAKKITLKNVGRDKYFRLLADVSIDGTDLGEWEIAQGYARPYSGQGKKPW